MNKSIPGNFNFFKALKYLKKNDQIKPFILKDIKNEDNFNFYNQLNKGKPTVIQTQLTPKKLGKSLTEREINNYKLRNNSFQYEDNKNIENNLDTNKYKKENRKNDFNIIETSPNFKRNLSNSSKSYKKIRTINYMNDKEYNEFFSKKEEKKSQISEYCNFKTETERTYFNRTNPFSISNSINDIIKIEDILLISERLEAILQKINNKTLFDENEKDDCASQECFEYLSFYFDSSLLDHYTCYFSNVHHVIIKSSNNLELFYVILTYHLSLNPKFYMKYKSTLSKIYPFIKNNFLLMIKKIINDIYNNEDEDYLQTNCIYLQKINNILKENVKIDDSEQIIVSSIIDNSKKIVENIKSILANYQNENKIKSLELTTVFNNISKLPNVAINEFFYDKILYIPNKEGSIINKLSLNTISNNNEIQAPYINELSKKKYTLVLDLDETLFFLKFSKKNDKRIIHFRPYLYNFLDSLFPFYELISFTTATKIYAEPILDIIEKNKKYFSYKFYREHAIIRDNNLIKDISRIGRDMSKILLVDNMSHNFYLNEDNGILIYPFYNENNQDTSLLELKRILITIYYKNYKDIRVAIKDFKNEIIMKVSCNSNSFNKKKIK